MILGKLADIVATERRLHSVDRRVLLQLIEESHASSGFLRLLVPETRVVVYEEGAQVAVDEWEDAGVLRRVRIVASIHENVFASTMAMEISEDEHLSLFDEVVDHLLRVVDCGMQDSRWSFPASVEITAS